MVVSNCGLALCCCGRHGAVPCAFESVRFALLGLHSGCTGTQLVRRAGAVFSLLNWIPLLLQRCVPETESVFVGARAGVWSEDTVTANSISISYHATAVMLIIHCALDV